MKIHHVFYAVGVIFIFSAVLYFAKEFILDLSPVLKVVLLIISVIVTFVAGELMREADI